MTHSIQRHIHPSVLETDSILLALQTSLATYPGFGIDIGTISEQNADDVSLVGTGSQMQGGLTTHSGSVRVGVVLDQVDHDVHVTHEGCHVQRSQTRLEKEHYWLRPVSNKCIK